MDYLSFLIKKYKPLKVFLKEKEVILYCEEETLFFSLEEEVNKAA